MNYFAYNLTLQSDISLPLPLSTSGKPDIVITFGELDEPENLSRTHDGVWYAYGSDFLYLKWENIGTYLIKEGGEIILSPSQKLNSTEQLLLVPLLGTVMAIALYQKGLTALHGSSVKIDDKALIFLGAKGEGKSTMAGYFRKQGHTLISDDVCAVDMHKKDVPLIYPSFPQLKLWPDAMRYLDYKTAKHKRVHPQFEKRNISLDTGFSATPCRVAAIIVLKTGVTDKHEILTGHKAIPALLPHLIINRFPELQPDSLKKEIYFQLTELIKSIPVHQLERPRDISLLPALSELVQKNI